MKNLRKYLLIFLVFLLMKCGDKISNSSEEGKEEIKTNLELSGESINLAKIKIGKVEKRKLIESNKVLGEVTINPKKAAEITSTYSGMIKEVYHFEGDRVRKGERLAGIFSKEVIADQADYLLVLKRYKREREKGDNEGMKLSEWMLKSAEQRLKLFGMDEKEIQELSERRFVNDILYVKAPINGTIIESNIFIGTNFEEGFTLFKIADIENLWVVVNIHEKDMINVKLNSSVEIKISSSPEKIFHGKLTAIGSFVDKGTKTVKGRIEIFDKSGILKPGMFVEALIYKEGTEEILSVPEEAIRKIEGKDVVFVVRGNGSFEVREVKLGKSIGEYIEIKEGLKEGEDIVTEGSFILKSHTMREKMEVD